MAVDYKALNKITLKDEYLPRVQDLIQRLGKAQWFTKLDLQKGYSRRLVESLQELIIKEYTCGTNDSFTFKWNYQVQLLQKINGRPLSNADMGPSNLRLCSLV